MSELLLDCLVKVSPTLYVNTRHVVTIAFKTKRGTAGKVYAEIKLSDRLIAEVSEEAGYYLLEQMDTRKAIILPGEEVPEEARKPPSLTSRLEAMLRNDLRGATAAQLAALLQLENEQEIVEALGDLVVNGKVLAVGFESGTASLYYSIYNIPTEIVQDLRTTPDLSSADEGPEGDSLVEHSES